MCIYIYIYYVFSPRYAFTSKVSQEIWPWKIRSIPPERFPSFEETATREILPRLLVVFNNIDEEDVCLDHWVVSLVCCHMSHNETVAAYLIFPPREIRGISLVTSILITMMVDILLYITGLLFGGRTVVAIGFLWCYRFWMLVIAGEYVFWCSSPSVGN